MQDTLLKFVVCYFAMIDDGAPFKEVCIAICDVLYICVTSFSQSVIEDIFLKNGLLKF